MLNDPYDALGLTKVATADDIKKSYRKLVRANHPDLHPDDAKAEVRFKAITGAYDLLRDPETRARFDAGEIDGLGVERPQRPYYRDFAGGPDNAYQQTRGFGQNADPADIFADILRNRGQARGDEGLRGHGFSAAGPDARYALKVPFLDAANGGEARITLPNGQSLAVKIPRGTENGQTLRLRGKGGAGFGDGPDGDALITIGIRPHAVFRREGADILLTLPITIDEAVLGGPVTVPTIDGPVSLNIPPAASSGRILRMRGRGVAAAGKKTKGDQKIDLKIVMPPDIDVELHDFLTTWRKTKEFNPRIDLMKGAGQ